MIFGQVPTLPWCFGIKNVAKACCKRDGIKILDSKTGDIKAILYNFSVTLNRQQDFQTDFKNFEQQ